MKNGLSSGAVTIVIVTFNSEAVLADCLNSLPPDANLIIVDNASRDGTRDLARRLRQDALIVAEPINRGFGGAANIGFSHATTEFGLLLNADVRLGPAMIDRLIEAASRYPRAGMMAPTATEKGKIFLRQTVFFSRPTKGRSAVTLVPEGDICCDYVGGSAMFFRMAAFRTVGGFDENLFLFYEDDDLCLRMKRAGYELIQVYDARLDHLSGKSTTAFSDLDDWKQFHMAWSRMHVERKHRGTFAAATYLAREGGSCAFKYLTRPHDKRRRRYAARLAGLAAFVRGRRATDIRLGRANEPQAIN